MTFTRKILKTASALAVTLCMALPATAQMQTDAIGTLDATIDGAPYSGETLSIPSEGTATAEYMAIGPMTTVTVQAHDPQAESIMRNILSVEIMLMGNDLAGNMMEPTVSYWPGGMSAPFYMSEGSGTVPSVTIDEVSLTEGAAFIRGSFTAQPCKQESFFAEMDLQDCVTIEGRFDTVLHMSDL